MSSICPARLLLAVLFAADPHTGAVRVFVTDQPVNRFDPTVALGAGIDGHEQGDIAKMLSPANVAAMRSAGLKPLSYRLRTELASEAWHWNPEGRWSDPRHHQGYWVSNTRASKPIRVSYGYRLPRRGNTVDQANNDGYSRLDDGDPHTFWKSNPFLDRYFTGEDNSLHPQWVVIDLGQPTAIDTLRILWGEPYATAFRIEYSTEKEIEITAAGIWRTLLETQGSGGEQAVRLASPITTRYIRLLMTAYSGTAPSGSADVRDRIGVAIREIYAGGAVDLIRHARDRTQTMMYVSSTDPWHRARDRDGRTEQPGFDLLYRDGLANGLPVLMAVPVLYDVPENAANQIRYLKSHHYPVVHAELGEEPEEQYIAPEDYGALYLQWAKALHGVDPALQIGGTSMVLLHADAEPEPSWTKRLFAWLRSRASLDQFHFFSFEWYPFDEVCDPAPPQLAKAGDLFAAAIERLHRDGVPPDMPMFLTEYGYSAYGSEAEVTLPGALLNAEIPAQFLTLGGARTYLYGYEPNELLNEKECTWGNNMLFLMGGHGRIESRMAVYYAARLLTQEWASPHGGVHEVYRAASDTPPVTAFALRRPDGEWSVLLINKNPENAREMKVKFDGAAREAFSGSVDVYQYSAAQYEWKADGGNGHVVRESPPVHSTAAGDAAIALPSYSLTVVRGRW